MDTRERIRSVVRGARPPIAVILLFALLVPSHDAVPQGQLTLDAEVGLGGAFAAGRTTPIRVLIDHRGPSLSGELVVRQRWHHPLGTERTVELRKPITLGERARQLHELYLPLSDRPPKGSVEPQLMVSLLLGGREVATRRVELAEAAVPDPLILMLSEGGYLRELPTGERVVWVDAAELPRSWLGYGGVRRIYLGRFEAQTLSPERREALTRWLFAGGELVVLGGENAHLQEAPWLEEILPFHLVGVRRVGAWDLSVAEGQPTGEVLYSAGGVPLLVGGAWGRGVLYYSALALTGSSEVERAVWARLAPDGPEDPELPELSSELLGAMALPFPSKLVVGGLMALYVTGFGLLSLWTLRRPRGRREGGGWRTLILGATWLGLLTGATLGYLLQPAFTGLAHSLEAGVIWGTERTGLAHAQSWYSAMPKRTLPLAWSVGHDTLVRPQEETDLVLRSTPGGVTLLPPGGRLTARQQEDLYLEAFLPLEIRVEVDRREGPVGGVRVYNRSPWTLEDAVLVREGPSDDLLGDGIFYPLEDLPSGKVREMALPEMGATTWLGLGSLGSFEGRVKRVLFERARAELPDGHRWALLAWVRQEALSRPPEEHRRVLKLLVIASASGHPERRGGAGAG